MGKKMYIGVGGVARKVKKAYIGVNGAARKVKKAYIGVGGVARPCFSGGELVYYGTLEKITTNSTYYDHAGASVGNYALFGGGIIAGGSGWSTLYSVCVYHASLVSPTNVQLASAAYALASTQTTTHAFFGGGFNNGKIVKRASAFNASLVRIDLSDLVEGGNDMAAASVGGCALFVPGRDMHTLVEGYNASLVKFTPTGLSVTRYDLKGASMNGYALFGGGRQGSTVSNAVDAYNASLMRITPTSLSVASSQYAAAGTEQYVLFGLGLQTSTNVDAYSTSLTRISAPALSLARTELAAAAVQDFVLFGGGHALAGTGDNGGYTSSKVDCYDSSLVRSTPAGLGVGRGGIATATVANFAIFCGGRSGPGAPPDVYAVL